MKMRYEASLLAIPGVVGVAADLRDNAIIAYVESVADCERVPRRIEGFPVRCEVVGRIRPL